MLTKILTDLLGRSFEQAGYDKKYGDVVVSNRPDLCQFQCNGSMPAAKEYRRPPFEIADKVVEALNGFEETKEIIKEAVMVRPGFINITLTDVYIAKNTSNIAKSEKLGVQEEENPKKIVIDYGGPNVAKPLHVGHLRTAIIGESLKRILKFKANDVTGDIHLGDWGLQMGMIISDIKNSQPDLPYFDENFEGEYPTEAPFTLSDLEEIYPRISKASKEIDENGVKTEQAKVIYEQAKIATSLLQQGNKGYRALWKHIVNISVNDIKRNYKRLNVDFDLWYGESDAHEYIEDTLNVLRKNETLYESDGAFVCDVTKEDDKKELPPIILIKSDGSYMYGTTDLATIYQRVRDFNPDEVLYVVDQRQGTHFVQVFRCAYDNKIVKEGMQLEHIGFGTMNGKDGKPFKTRAGGVLRLEALIDMVEENVAEKIRANAKANDAKTNEEDIKELASIIGLATLKFADLSNYRMKDYVFDVDKFSSFEGKTGPYILYSTVRIKNIIRKLETEKFEAGKLLEPTTQSEKDLMLKLDGFDAAIRLSAIDRAPNVLCEYVYELATLVNGFYHAHHIINEKDLEVRASWYSLLKVTLEVLEKALYLLGIKVPERM